MTTSEFVYLLVGACLALGSQMLVQLVIVPRVELRKRREDRWERHVLDLGEVLTVELDQYAEASRQVQSKFHFLRKMIAENPDDYDKHRAKEVLEEAANDMREADRVYSALVGARIEWLVDRICGPIEGPSELMNLRLAFMKYHTSEMATSIYRYSDDIYDPDEFERVWTRERDSARELRERVSKLADRPALRHTKPLTQAKEAVKKGGRKLYRIWAGEPRKR